MARESKLQVYRSNTASAVPAQLYQGEFGWNSFDKKLWIGDSGEAIVPIHLMPTPDTTGYTTAWNNTEGRWKSVSSLKVDMVNGTVSIGDGINPHTSVSLSSDSGYFGKTDGLKGLNAATLNILGTEYATLFAGSIGQEVPSTSVSMILGGFTTTLACSDGAGGINSLISLTNTDGIAMIGTKIRMASLPVGPGSLPAGSLYRLNGTANSPVYVV